VAAFLVLIGFTLLAPGFTLLVERLAGPSLRRLLGIEAALGARYLREGVARTGVVVAALMVSVGMMVALAIMVGSFRHTVDLWVGQTIRGDLYVEPAGHRSNASATSLPDGFVDAVRALPGVAGVDTYRGTRVRYGDRLAFVAGVDFGVQERFGRLRFMAGSATRILRRARERDGVIVTESFSRHHRLAVGDSVEIAGAKGLVRFPIEGVFYDYSTDAGGVMMDVALYQRVFATRRTESLALFLAPGSSPAEIREQVIERAGPGLVLYVSPNQSLRRQVLKVFDQTFQITGALQAIAVLVAVLGLVTTLTTLVLQRGREIGILRAAGALERQIRTMVLVESGLLGLIGTLLGCACGTVLALLLVHVIHRQFFGWTIRLELDPWVYARTFALFLATSLIAGLWPARLAARRVAAESMRID
jgi:putative ABC transport system permease protein